MSRWVSEKHLYVYIYMYIHKYVYIYMYIYIYIYRNMHVLLRTSLMGFRGLGRVDLLEAASSWISLQLQYVPSHLPAAKGLDCHC